MTGVLAVALDLLREAASRRWFLALGLAVTAVLLATGLALDLEVVDGALAASRLFGSALANDIVPVDVALRPVFRAAAYVIFYGGLAFGILACADFGPQLLAPGRIEHLLSLPVRRWQLLAGTFLGVLALGTLGALYGAGGLALILGVKTHVFTLLPAVAALLSVVAFAGIYAVMLSLSVVVRSAALSAAAGATLFVLGIVAGYRDDISPALEAGPSRVVFRVLTLLLPRVSALADVSADLAASAPIDLSATAALCVGVLAFGGAALAAGIFHLEGKDF